jgi:hypothetical protein
MNRIVFGAAAVAAVALAPGLASAQYYGYYAPQPYYGAPVYTAAPAPYPAYAPPSGYYGSSMPYGYNAPAPYTWGSFPEINRGQASASAHGPSYDNVLSTQQSH